MSMLYLGEFACTSQEVVLLSIAGPGGIDGKEATRL